MKLKYLLTASLMACSFFGNIQAKSIQDYIEESKTFYENERYDDAITMALKVLDKDPNHVYANWYCSVSYFNIEFYSEALRYYKRVVELDENAAYYSNLGGMYSRLGYEKPAIEAFDKSIELNPNYVVPISNMAALHALFYRIDEANAYFDRAMIIDPTEIDIYFNRAVMFKMIGEYEEAERWLQGAFERAEDPRRFYMFSEELNKKLNPKYKYSKAKLNAALASYDESIKKNRYNTFKTFRRGECYERLGNKYRAKQDYLRALDLINEVLLDMPTSCTQVSLRADIYKALGMKEEAIRDYKRVLELNPIDRDSMDKIEELSK